MTDVKSFYPTVDISRVRQLWETSAGKVDLPNPVREGADRVGLLVQDVRGLKIGTSFSHYLANLYLADLDQRLSASFPGRYFRYVDDVAVVVPIGDVETAHSMISREFEAVGLSLNTEKNAVATLDDWLARGVIDAGSKDPFNRLKWAIKFFLATRPSEEEHLRRLLLEDGCALPIGSLRIGARDEGWRTRMLVLIGAGWKLPAVHYTRGAHAVLQSARDARDAYFARLRDLVEAGVPANPVRRKWVVSRARYLMNRLLYLVHEDQFAELADTIPAVPELGETVEVIRAVATRDISRVVGLPGPTAMATAEQFAFRSMACRRPVETAGDPPFGIHKDALAPFLLRGVSGADAFVQHGGDAIQELARACAGSGPSRGPGTPIRWIDEIAGLLRGVDPEQLGIACSRRAFSSEPSSLDALNLGFEYYDAN